MVTFTLPYLARVVAAWHFTVPDASPRNNLCIAQNYDQRLIILRALRTTQIGGSRIKLRIRFSFAAPLPALYAFPFLLVLGLSTFSSCDGFKVSFELEQ